LRSGRSNVLLGVTDAEVASTAARGTAAAGDSDDERDFDAFYAGVSRRLVGQAYLLTGDIQEAEDLAQEALSRAWHAWPRVSRFEDPEAWSRRVLHNLAVSRWRRDRTRRREEPRLAAVATAPPLDDRQLELVGALRRLPVAQRRALVLKAVGGLSVEEIAVDMGASAGTVRMWLTRARRAMAESIEREGQS
jgi:RNA polymerase sigma-70 factor (ECF subfamily)